MKKAAIYMGAAALALFLVYGFFSDGEGFQRIGVVTVACAIGYAVLAWGKADARKRERAGERVKYGDKDGNIWRDY
jgi:hypothetical protein